MIVFAALSACWGCGKAGPGAVHFHWWAGSNAPAFDPDGPPDPLRATLERLLTRSLVTEDSLGAPVLEAATALAISPDRLRYTFTLPAGLRFVDGTPCGSEAFRSGLLAGLERTDHGTRAWLLGAVRGVDAVRPRRPLPPIAITAPGPATLVIELARPDPLLLRRLAVPGASSAWAKRGPQPAWTHAVGLGPYRVLRADLRAMVMTRFSGSGPDTVSVRFAEGAARARTALRSRTLDLMWPVPPSLLDQPLAAGWSQRARAAIPGRRLSLVMRADVPPTTKLAARRALAHGIARGEVVRRVGPGASDVREWLPGGGIANLPALDLAQTREWLERGKLGRSFHVLLAFDAGGAGAAVARALQGSWARFGLYVDLGPLRGAAFSKEALSGQAQALLVEESGIIPGPIGVLATSVLPLRGPAVGAFRSGWRTREFDPWLIPRNQPIPFNSDFARRRLEEETVVVPLCDLAWVWIERGGGHPVGFHPRFGPSPSGAVTLTKSPR